ncbi:hypothetical protein FB45DRAFT_1001386 [Roridomyces roridus]|uniref:Uncharacterized protein n=1 Tax=Roridomyces roridus TaxID=1738132 RepID=A0AAD7C5U0_9AGAR|nr:hypothetical protein FB45DRAFT_1001386 [Roridomyces roridus]
MPPLRRIPFTTRNRPALPNAITADALDATKVTLRAIRASSDACAPLKSGVSVALVLLEMTEKIKRNKKDTQNLAERAAQLVLDIWGQTKDLSTQIPPEEERCIHEIETLFREIEEFFHELEKEKLWKRFIRQDRHQAQVEEYASLLDLATSQFSMILQLSIRSAQMAQNSADEKRHDDVLAVSHMSEAERLLLTKIDARSRVGMQAALGVLFFFLDRHGFECWNVWFQGKVPT